MFEIAQSHLRSKYETDIQVEGKVEQVVMILANPKGRRIVEDLWPDVQWTRDEVSARAHSADWSFTHVRVTRLPPHFETPPTLASTDALGLAVASIPIRAVRDIILAVFDKLGGEEAFFKWVQESDTNRRLFYAGILTKLLPFTLEGKVTVIPEKMARDEARDVLEREGIPVPPSLTIDHEPSNDKVRH